MILTIILPAVAAAGVIGTVGATYPFAERDGLSEIVDRAKQVDWKRLFAEAREKAKHYRPEIPKIPRASNSQHRRVVMSYVLDVDVPDPNTPAQIRYPRGYEFNPLEYFTMPACVVFINAEDYAQRAWLLNYLKGQGQDPLTQILLTGGEIDQVEKLLKRPVYFADALLLERFNIEAVPAVACQVGALLDVEEIDVRKNTRH